jgi:hypothetical protein
MSSQEMDQITSTSPLILIGVSSRADRRRLTERDKVKMGECFRLGDIVKAKVVSGVGVAARRFLVTPIHLLTSASYHSAMLGATTSPQRPTSWAWFMLHQNQVRTRVDYLASIRVAGSLIEAVDPLTPMTPQGTRFCRCRIRRWRIA